MRRINPPRPECQPSDGATPEEQLERGRLCLMDFFCPRVECRDSCQFRDELRASGRLIEGLRRRYRPRRSRLR